MAISSSRVQQGGGGNLMQQMSAEVVDLYKHFENLAQTRRQVDIMQREQNAQALGPMMDKMVKDRGGWYSFLQTGPEAQTLAAGYLQDVTGLGAPEAQTAVKHMAGLDPSQADMLGMLMNAGANGDKGAIQMVNQLSKAGVLAEQAHSRGDERTAIDYDAIARTALDKAIKDVLGVSPEEARAADAKRKQGTPPPPGAKEYNPSQAFGDQGKETGTETGVPTDTMRALNLPTLEGMPQSPNKGITIPDLFTRGAPMSAEESAGKMDTVTRAADALGPGVPGDAAPIGPRRTAEPIRGGIAGGNVKDIKARVDQEARGRWSQNVSTRQAFERAKENGQIPSETTFEEHITRTMMPDSVKSAPQYVQDNYVEIRKEIADIDQKEESGEMTPEAAGDARHKKLMEVFQVQQQANTENMAESFDNPADKKITKKIAEVGGKTDSAGKLLQEMAKTPGGGKITQETMNRIGDAFGPAFKSAIEDAKKGQKPPKGKMDLIKVQANRAVPKERVEQINAWYSNMVSTGAINNPAYVWQAFPEIAATVERVNQDIRANEKLNLAKDELKLRQDQFAYQKWLDQQMMDLEEKMAMLKAQDPAGALGGEVMGKLVIEYLQTTQTAIKEGWDERKMQDFVEGNPWLTWIEGYNQVFQQGTGIELSIAEETYGLFERMKRGLSSLMGNDPSNYLKYATPNYLREQESGVKNADVNTGDAEADAFLSTR